MKPLESLVTPLKLSQLLFEAGISKEVAPLFYWVKTGDKPDHHLLPSNNFGWMHADDSRQVWTAKLDEECSAIEMIGQEPFYPALTLEELINLLPECIPGGKCQHELRVGKGYAGYRNEEYWCGPYEVGDSSLEALCALTEWLLDNNHLSKQC